MQTLFPFLHTIFDAKLNPLQKPPLTIILVKEGSLFLFIVVMNRPFCSNFLQPSPSWHLQQSFSLIAAFYILHPFPHFSWMRIHYCITAPLLAAETILLYLASHPLVTFGAGGMYCFLLSSNSASLNFT